MKESELDDMQTELVSASEEALTTMKALTEVAKKGKRGQYRLCFLSSKLDLIKFNLSISNRLMILTFML